MPDSQALLAATARDAADAAAAVVALAAAAAQDADAHPECLGKWVLPVACVDQRAGHLVHLQLECSQSFGVAWVTAPRLAAAEVAKIEYAAAAVPI